MSFLRFLEFGIAGALLVWRLIAQPVEKWPVDIAAILVVMWMGLMLANERPRIRTGVTTAASVWLIMVYALYQGPHTFWLFLE